MTTPEPADLKPLSEEGFRAIIDHYLQYKTQRLPGDVDAILDAARRYSATPSADPLLLEVLNFIERCYSLEINCGDKMANALLERNDLRERAKSLYTKINAVKWGVTSTPPAAPVAKPVADETAARCGESQPGSKPDNSIPGAAVLDEKLREAVKAVEETSRRATDCGYSWPLIKDALAELAELRAKATPPATGGV